MPPAPRGAAEHAAPHRAAPPPPRPVPGGALRPYPYTGRLPARRSPRRGCPPAQAAPARYRPRRFFHAARETPHPDTGLPAPCTSRPWTEASGVSVTGAHSSFSHTPSPTASSGPRYQNHLPSRVIPTGTASKRVPFMACRTAQADCSETACSVDCPPNSTATFIFSIWMAPSHCLLRTGPSYRTFLTDGLGKGFQKSYGILNIL